MAQTHSSAVSAQLAASVRRPVNLFILDLGSGVTLRYATAKSNVTFPSGGNTFTAKACSHDPIEYSANSHVGRVAVKLDNTAKDLAAYANATDFVGRKLTIWRIFRDASGTTDYDVVFSGYMEAPSFDYNWINISVVAGMSLSKTYPDRNYGRSCSWSFGGTECNTDSLADLTSNSLTTGGTVVRGGVTHLYDTMLHQSAASTWTHARVRMYVSGVTEERIATDFKVTAASGGTVFFDVPCATTIGASTRYEMIMGCSKNWTACSGVSAFGPTADNSANFGGFLHVARKADKDTA
jgi:hypothetical protein